MRRWLDRRSDIRLPVLADPDPARLIAFPGDAELPLELRDPAVLADALSRQVGSDAPNRPEHRGERRSPATRSIGNVVFVSHCDFTGNSALHVLAIALGLHRRGLSPVIAVPDNADSVEDVGRPPFPVVTYRDARRALRFPDGRGPDLVHAFTPRELVRRLTVELVRAHGCPYVVQLEDNEEAILSAELGGMDVEGVRQLPAPLLDRAIGLRQFHPLRGARFLEHAAGVTVVVARLLELAPPDVPSTVVGAGFDEAVLSPRRPRDEVRAELGLAPDDVAIVYTGNIHRTNLDDMRELYAAVAELRRDGLPIVLVKTGWNSPEAAELPRLEEGLRDLGWVPRGLVPELLAAADVLVQPGGPGPFNDYRFPSKLPEFLASGRPVVLPRTNLGLDLRDGEEAIVLEHGDAAEITATVARLATDPALRERVGAGGRRFALRELRWTRSVDRVEQLYGEIAAAAWPVPPAWLLEGGDPPVRLVAIVPTVPNTAETHLARAHGIYGFCLHAAAAGEPPDAPFCLRLDAESRANAEAVARAVDDPRYIRVDGAPLLLGDADDSDAGTPLARSSGSHLEPLSAPKDAADYGALVLRRLAAAPSQRAGLPRITPPPAGVSWEHYELWLRKLVLQALLLAPRLEPLLLVDATGVWSDSARRAAWLAATRSGLRDGLRQFYACRQFRVTARQAERMTRLA